jgi:hypothetical protein
MYAYVCTTVLHTTTTSYTTQNEIDQASIKQSNKNIAIDTGNDPKLKSNVHTKGSDTTDDTTSNGTGNNDNDATITGTKKIDSETNGSVSVDGISSTNKNNKQDELNTAANDKVS